MKHSSAFLSQIRPIPRTGMAPALFSTSGNNMFGAEEEDAARSHVNLPQHNWSSTNRNSRRSFLSFLAFTTTAATTSLQSAVLNDSPFSATANAAETIGKDPNCNDSSCLGVWDGLFADCPHDNIQQGKFLGGGASCVSSQDDTPGIFAEPWDYSDSIPLASGDDDSVYRKQMDLLIVAIQSTSKQHGDDVQILFQEGRYLRAQFTDGSTGEKSIGEFYFTPSDITVQFRIGSISKSLAGIGGRSLSNTERAERIRKSLRYLKVPVLRNRKRSFFFVESDDFDGFGPGSNALGPPEEMSPGESGVVDGVKGGRTRRGSDDVDPRLRIDWVEEFPFKGN